VVARLSWLSPFHFANPCTNRCLQAPTMWHRPSSRRNRDSFLGHRPQTMQGTLSVFPRCIPPPGLDINRHYRLFQFFPFRVLRDLTPGKTDKEMTVPNGLQIYSRNDARSLRYRPDSDDLWRPFHKMTSFSGGRTHLLSAGSSFLMNGMIPPEQARLEMSVPLFLL